MLKEKICKGTNKAKGHGCGQLVPVEMYGKSNRTYGLGRSCGCYQKWLISEDGKQTFDNLLLKNKKKFELEQKRKMKKEKETLIDYGKKLQNKINEIVRLIDIGHPCLARGHHADQMHGGHIFSRGSNPTIKFNLHVIHRQSAQSNHFQNEDGLFRDGLIKEYGSDYFEFISALRQTKVIKYNNSDFKKFYKHACTLCNELKKQGRFFATPKERIFMRNEINNILGIYHDKYCIYKNNND